MERHDTRGDAGQQVEHRHARREAGEEVAEPVDAPELVVPAVDARGSGYAPDVGE
jgi:hypothetical protein